MGIVAAVPRQVMALLMRQVMTRTSKKDGLRRLLEMHDVP